MKLRGIWIPPDLDSKEGQKGGNVLNENRKKERKNGFEHSGPSPARDTDFQPFAATQKRG